MGQLLRYRISPSGKPANQTILAAVDALDRELLAWLDVVLRAKLSGQHDLALGRDGGLHLGKIPSYATHDKPDYRRDRRSDSVLVG